MAEVLCDGQRPQDCMGASNCVAQNGLTQCNKWEVIFPLIKLYICGNLENPGPEPGSGAIDLSYCRYSPPKSKKIFQE